VGYLRIGRGMTITGPFYANNIRQLRTIQICQETQRRIDVVMACC